MRSAKAFLLSRDRPAEFRPADLSNEFSRQQGYEELEELVVSGNAVPEPQLAQVAGRLSCALAFAQALWEMVYSGRYMTFGALSPHIYTTLETGAG